MSLRQRKVDSKNETSNDSSEINSLNFWQKLKTKREWTSNELSEVIHWFRQIIGIVCGLVWGIIPITGFLGNILYMFVNFGVIFLWYDKYQDIDDEEYGGRFELMKEGLPSSISLFLICWILSYNFRLEYLE